MPAQQILLKKQQLSSELAAKIKKYNAITVIGIQGVSGRMISELRSRLRGLGEVTVAKNSLIARALNWLKEERADIEKIANLTRGSNAIILSNLSPFLLSSTIDEIKGSDWIKVGGIAPNDIKLSAGDLGLPPGGPAAILTDMGAKIKIVKGTIRLDEDFVLVHAGEKVSAAVATLLMALDIKPIQLSFELKGAWDGIFIPGEKLHLDIGQYEKDLAEAEGKGLALAVEAEIFNEESAPLIIQKSVREAIALASTGGFYAPDEFEAAIRGAVSSASAIKSIINT